MILIADSGSTKTDWALTDGAATRYIQTQGLSPVHQSPDAIAEIMAAELMPGVGGADVGQVFFYGAGCTHDAAGGMCRLIKEATGSPEAAVESDIVGAARALFGCGSGIACILGTGSNSCVFDGCRITGSVPPLGYILGDEGSGAALGKMFLNAIFKGGVDSRIRDAYLEETRQTYADVIRRVYREPLAGRYLASVAKFVGGHKDDMPELGEMVMDNFRLFIMKNVDRYGRHDLPLGFVGSIAWFFGDELRAVAAECGYSVGKILRRPIEELVAFHTTIQSQV